MFASISEACPKGCPQWDGITFPGSVALAETAKRFALGRSTTVCLVRMVLRAVCAKDVGESHFPLA